MKRMLWFSVTTAILLMQFGCRNSCGGGGWCGGKTSAPAPVFVPPPPPTQMMPPAGVQQSGGFPTLPPGALVNPPPGALVNPPPRTLVNPSPGALVNPSPGALVNPSPGALVNPSPGVLGNPSPGALVNPPSGALGNPPSGALVNPSPGALVNPPQGPKIQPPSPPPSISNAPPGGNGNGQPKETQEPPANRNVPPGIRLYAPESLEKEEPPAKQKPKLQATLPPIPQFAAAKDNVYTGLRPGLDGLDWLRDNRVGTVVQFLLPGEDDSSDKKQVEERGMRYVGFEISPQTLTKAKADEFIKLVRDGAKRGIFVYDQNSSLAGAMWYLYFREGEFLDDDASQLRARELGLNLNRNGQHRDMWLAVQKMLSPQ